MTVAEFPKPEPWPAELFEQYGIADLEQLVADCQAEIDRRHAAAVAVEAMCPDCGDIAHPAQTTCEGCGSRLTPGNPTASAATSLDGLRAADAEEVRSLVAPIGCTCGGQNICQACVIAEYDRTPLVAVEATIAALERPANVVAFPGYSKRAPVIDREPTDDEIYNRAAVEGGIGYTVDVPGSLGENDWRL